MIFETGIQIAIAIGTVGTLVVGVLNIRSRRREDRRRGEFRRVSWSGEWEISGDDAAVFTLRNTGRTQANHVRVEIFLGTLGDEPVLSEPLGTFKPGQSKPAVIKNDLLVHAQMMERVMFKGERRVAQVWWMSPLGEPETYDIYERS